MCFKGCFGYADGSKGSVSHPWPWTDVPRPIGPHPDPNVPPTMMVKENLLCLLTKFSKVKLLMKGKNLTWMNALHCLLMEI